MTIQMKATGQYFSVKLLIFSAVVCKKKLGFLFVCVAVELE